MSPDRLGINRPRAGTPTVFTRRSFKAICWFIAGSGPGLAPDCTFFTVLGFECLVSGLSRSSVV